VAGGLLVKDCEGDASFVAVPEPNAETVPARLLDHDKPCVIEGTGKVGVVEFDRDLAKSLQRE
jgi:hypothetical protein